MFNFHFFIVFLSTAFKDDWAWGGFINLIIVLLHLDEEGVFFRAFISALITFLIFA